MKTATLRTIAHEKQHRYVKPIERGQQQITLIIPSERLNQINKYLRNAERGHLPMANAGADVTRPITELQVQKFLECSVCQAKPVVFFQHKVGQGKKSRTECVGVCESHWIKLSESVVGWSEEYEKTCCCLDPINNMPCDICDGDGA